MDARLMLFTASALGFATIAAAEPVRPTPSAQSQERDRAVVLAAADVPASPAADAASTDAPAPPARKARTARASSCRCAATPNP